MHSNNPEYKNNLVLKLTFQFALDIVAFREELDQVHKYAVSHQLIRSGTSIGANVREAQNAESIADFIHKLKIVLKELNETEYWLLLCKEAPGYPNQQYCSKTLYLFGIVLNKILSSSIRKKNLTKHKTR